MRLSYDYGQQRIEFNVIYRRRKTLAIQVKAPSCVTVIAPAGMRKEAILQAVQGKSKWIVKKLLEIAEMQRRKGTREYVNGESFLYLGRNYSLQIEHDELAHVPEVKLLRGKLVVRILTRDEESIKKALQRWYQGKAVEKIWERVNYFQDQFDVKPAKVIVKEQQKRWGSCSAKGNLLFNWKTIMAPSSVVDYIVVHEMCHLVHLNHSKQFWQLVKTILPDYEVRRKALRDNGMMYDL